MPKTYDHSNVIHVDFTHFDVREIIEGIRARYVAASSFVFQYEGGYVNDPDDPGGCTNMGITIGTLQVWRNDHTLTCDDVKMLTKTEAQLIYAQNYWAPVWGNQLPIGVNTQLYDFGVNAGPSTAIKTLQRIVGASADGIMGSKTLAATQASVDNYGAPQLLKDYHYRRQEYYESLSNFSKYGTGWTNRNDACYVLSTDLNTQGPLTVERPENTEIDDIMSRVSALEMWREDVASVSMNGV